MERPIRLNRTFVQKVRPNLERGCPDPRALLSAGIGAREATDIIARIKIGGVFKTTSDNRFPETTRLLAATAFPSPPVIVDVGASDGSTSLSVMQAMQFSRYYVTDRHIYAWACTTRKGVFFCDAQFVPFMFANRFFVIYNDPCESSSLQSGVVARLFGGFDAARCKDMRKVALVNRALLPKLGNAVRLEHYSIFDRWPFEKADLVIAANILNRGYFSDTQLVDALKNLKSALKDAGRLAVIENRRMEQSNVFRLVDGRFLVENEVGSGSDIKSLVTGLS